MTTDNPRKTQSSILLVEDEIMTAMMEHDGITFEELFNLADIQRLQDQFAEATGVASIITHTDGSPITRPSNFCRLCSEIIRKTDKGLLNCYKSDAALGKLNLEGPTIQPCLSGGLWDSGAGISVGGKHIANWLIGQVRDNTQTDENMRAYAREIGADEEAVIEAFHKVPAMSREQFEKVSQVLFTLASQLSETAYQNVQQSRFILERQRAEAVRQKQEAHLRTLVETIPDLIWLKDPAGVYMACNPKFERFFGAKESEIVGKTDYDFVDKELADFFREKDKAAMDAGRSSINEEEITQANDGRRLLLETIKTPMYDSQGTLLGVLGIARDITERKRMEEEIRQSEETYRKLLNNLNAGVVVHAPDTSVLIANPTACALLGLSEEQMLGKEAIDPQWKFLHDDGSDLPLNEYPVNRLLSTKKALRNLVIGVKRPRTDDVVWVLVNGFAVLHGSGKVEQVIVNFIDITERKHAEGSLRESEARYRLLADNISDVIWMRDLDLNLTYISPSMEKQSGLSVEEAMSLSFDESMTSISTATSVQVLGEELALESEGKSDPSRSNTLELELFHKDGTTYPVETTVSFLRDEAGKAIGIIGINRDITERKRAEEHLRESEAKFKTIFENKGTATGTFGDDGIITSCNTKLAELLGYTKEELVGTMTWSDFVDEKDLSRVQDYHSKRTKEIDNPPPAEYECWIVHKSGKRKCVTVNIGTIGSLRIVSLIDITKRVKAEIALKESEERFRALHNASFGGIAIHDNGIILECNKGLSEITGYSYDELIGMNGLDLISDDTRDRVIQNINAGYEKPYEATGVRKNGETYPLRLEAKNIPYKGKHVRVVEFRDITESKRIERELHRHRAHLEELVSERTAALQAANDELKSFAYIASHDLKAPLRAISRLADWLAEDYADVIDERGKEMTELLIGRVKRMDNLIEGILEYSRIGRVVAQCGPIDLNDLVAEVIDTLAPPDYITVMIDNELPVIVGDRIRLVQLFQNLIGNAVKFLGASKGEVRIGCMAEGSQWKFWVADTGPGIEERYCEQIFQIFQTLTPRDEQENTGVGLAIVKKIVEFYRGKIWVESTVGEGSTFFFLLPKKEAV